MEHKEESLRELDYIIGLYSKTIAGGQPIVMWMHEFRINTENHICKTYGIKTLAEFIHPMWGDAAYDAEQLAEIKARN
jgi:hypothetical protein